MAPSVGVTRLVAQPPLTPAVWYQRATPLVTTPVRGVEELDGPVPFTLLGDTVAAWFERADAQVKRIDLRTGAVRAFGRLGHGPMEFSNGCSISRWIGDSILVRDPVDLRATVMSLATGQGRQVRYVALDSAPGTRLQGLLEGNVVVTTIETRGSQDGPDGYFTDTLTLRVRRSGRHLREPIAFVGGSGVRLHYSGGALVSSPPVGLSQGYLIDTHRIVWVSSDNDTLYTWHVDGTTTAAPVRLPVHVLSAATRRTLFENWLAKGQLKPPMRDGFRRVVRMPERVPAVTRLYTSTADRFWMRVEQTPATTEAATIVEITERGQVTRCFRLAPTQRLLGIGAEVAITGEKTDDDLWRVKLGSIPAACPVRGALR